MTMSKLGVLSEDGSSNVKAGTRIRSATTLVVDPQARAKPAIITCTVRVHTVDREAEHSMDIDVPPDHTLNDLKKLVVSSWQGSPREAPRCASDLYAWREVTKSSAAAAAAYVVDAAMSSGGSASIGPRIVTRGHLKEVHAILTGVDHGPSGADGGVYLTWREAMTVVSSQLPGRRFSCPLGVVHEVGGRGQQAGHGVRVVMRADPFDRNVAADPNMTSVSGDLRDIYHTTCEDDVTTLEALFPEAGEDTAGQGQRRLSISVVCAASLIAHLRRTSLAKEAVWRAGVLRKYFPSPDAWASQPGPGTGPGPEYVSREHAVERAAFAYSQRAIQEARARMAAASGHSVVERCVLTGVAIHIQPSVAQAKTTSDEGVGHDVLGLVFAKFRVSREVPVVRFQDGDSVTYKVSRIALASSQADVQDYLGRCARLAVANSAAAKSARSGRRQNLQFLMVLSVGTTAVVHVKQDLSYSIMRFFSTSSANGGGALEDVAQTHAAANKRVIRTMWSIVSAVGGSSVLPMDDALLDWRDMDRVGGLSSTSVSINTVSTIAVYEGKVPTIAQVQHVLDRMFPYFVPVALPGKGRGTLFLQYRRVDRFENTEGLLQTLGLLREDPPEVIVVKIARAFGLSEEEATRRIEAELKNGKVPYIPTLLRSGVHVKLSSSVRGVVCRVSAATSAKQHRRIMQLLTLAVDVASQGDRGFLEWVAHGPAARRVARASSHVLVQAAIRRPRFLEDWEDEDDFEGSVGEWGPGSVAAADEGMLELDQDAEEVDALLDAEIEPQAQPARDVADSRPHSTGLGAGKNMSSHESLLREIQRSDPALFTFRKSHYSTSCGAVNDRQPVVVTKEELERMGPDAHTGAIAYGSTPALAATNRFICPDVWCPRSRIGMSLTQFEAAHRKCPLEETPVVSDNRYFRGKHRYPGFLNPSNHPDGMCMPCCFRLPHAKVGMCTAPSNPGFHAAVDTGRRGGPMSGAPDQDGSRQKEEDQRYLRNAKAPLDSGRYGLLPNALADLLGGKKRCGSREDGSGQMGTHSSCLVRRGTARHVQMFMMSVMLLLENPDAHDIGSFVGLVEKHLTPDLFVTLNDGRLARAIMKEVTGEGSAAKHEDVARFVNWILSDAAMSYVARSELAAVRKEARQILDSSLSDPSRINSLLGHPSVTHVLGTASLDLRREYVLFAAQLRYVDILRDPSIIKGYGHLLDLCSRPLVWLNPRRINILMFEGDDTPGKEDEVHFTCPYDGGGLERTLRLADPFALLLRSGEAYHPIVRVAISRQSGIKEQRAFGYDSERFIHQVVLRLLEGCKAGHPQSPDAVGPLLVALTALHDPATHQVLDYQLRLTGVLTRSRILIALPSAGPPLVGEAAVGMGTLYIADAIRQASASRGVGAKSVPAVLERLRAMTGASFSSPVESEQGTAILLEHLGVFVGTPVTDARTEGELVRATTRQGTRTLVKRFREALWQDAAAASELVFLRHGFNPLPPTVRRTLMIALVDRILGGGRSGRGASPDALIARLVEDLLYESAPLSRSHAALPVLAGALMLTDIDLVSSSLEALLERGRLALDGPSSGLEPSAMPTTRVVREGTSTQSTTAASSGTLLSLRKSLALPFATPSEDGSLATVRSGASARTQPPVLPGTKMVPCHPWRALSLAQYLVHTELRLDSSVPLMLMENDRIAASRKEVQNMGRGALGPTSPRYQPGLRDVEVLAEAFLLSVIVIHAGQVVFQACARARTESRAGVEADASPALPMLVLAWTDDHQWYVVLRADGSLLWLQADVKKIQAILQKL